MSGLTAAFNNAQRSLGTYSDALNTIQTNIANANTPGYARQRPVLAPVIFPDGTGTGVELTRVESLRSNVLDLQVLAAHQVEGRLGELATFFQTTEPVFRLNSNGGIDSALDAFFSSAAELSANPGDLTQRSSLLGAADGVAGAFRQANTELAARQNSVDTSIRNSVARINVLLEEIADLEGRRAQRDPRTPNEAVETRSQQAFEELSTLIGFDVQRQQDGALAVVSDSTALLTGVFARPLQVSFANGKLGVFDPDGKDITASIQRAGGSLGGALEARNVVLPELVANLDRLAKHFADAVNAQLAQGVDLSGAPGKALFIYDETAVTGAGRAAGTVGTATPAPPSQVQVDFSGPFTVSITATLDSFVAGSAPPGIPAPGDTISLRFVSADGNIDRTVTTSPLLGAETAAELATRINDQIALDPELAGLINVADAGGSLKLTLSEAAGQGFSLTASTAGSGFLTGLEPGGALGGQSAEEIAAALNAEIANQPELLAAEVRFTAVNGELRLDGDVPFDFTVTDIDLAATGFASGLNGAGSAGGLGVSGTLAVSDIRPIQIAAADPANSVGNENINAITALADASLVEGSTLNGFFAQLVAQFGGAASSTFSRLATQQQVTVASENLRDSFSGVDLNEEAVYLLQFEEGYQAMLRVIQVVNQLSDELLNLVR
ncbi:MAG: flagellar hook-associated protein FlgK [Acidobacteria bacterium]|nr:flagellar hook-associated protein FlgK [Acidobacteriota bacterium]MDA1236210.1 flagellar hook-associated protein FlgK [Acidobacteriota bacterium]